ncbi:MAG: tRNA (N(6)-L-threonylcarbamoyladenosine(37)-C(2))-methylthiotransferase MtaB [Planctomycetia bacterium]|nr:tRNA (N(6)-L-threonylcarbamoyladenosine(37)-C(2))-methylthiotransferase MtaB [Planctomycetia bacterium]
MPATLRAVTLGCKVNQYETEYLRQALFGIGYADAAPREAADLCLVNTCTVTAEGDAKGRQLIRRLARENPAARIVVMGCYATRAPADVAALPGVSEVVTDKRELPDLLGRFGVIDLPRGIGHFTGRHRAWVKVQDGCLLKCSFCIIPKVRPHLASRPIEDVEAEVRRLVDNGYREIVLTGIHLGHYGVERCRGLPKASWTRLWHLLQRLAELPGDFRLRLSNIEATEVTRELIDVMAGFPDRICAHLHVCLQSGSDRVLRRMRRRWCSRRFIDRCQLVKEKLDRPALTTDVIVGFPGETDDDFDDTCRVCREVGFSRIHVFAFSARAGTEAAAMKPRVPPEIVADRRAQLLALESELKQQYCRGLVGKRLVVLPESGLLSDGWMMGTACRYIPARLRGLPSWEGRLVPVRAAGFDAKSDGILVCEAQSDRFGNPCGGVAAKSTAAKE